MKDNAKTSKCARTEKPAPAKKPDMTVSEKGTELGVIRIHENVISSLVRKVVCSIDGVSRLAGSSIVDNIAELVGSRRIHDRAIAIALEEDKVSVDIKVNIAFGYKVPEVAAAIQSAIIEEVENVTGMSVTAVNVIIQEIEDPIEEAEKELAQSPKAE